MKKNLCFVIYLLSITYLGKAQTLDSFFAFRAGYLYSNAQIKEQPGSLLIKPDFDDKPGYYIGGFYHKKLSNLLVSRTEINF